MRNHPTRAARFAIRLVGALATSETLQLFGRQLARVAQDQVRAFKHIRDDVTDCIVTGNALGKYFALPLLDYSEKSAFGRSWRWFHTTPREFRNRLSTVLDGAIEGRRGGVQDRRTDRE